MATFADALAISIGLDPTAFRKGSAEVTASMRKTREGAVKEGKEIERSIDGASAAVDRLTRNALRLFAVFTAGRAVKDFVADITSADSALGRLAQRIGSSPEAISGLANAVARNGGSAEAAAGSFQRLSDSINELKTTGNSSALPAFAKLQGVSGKQISLNTDLTTTFLDLADAAKGTADKAGEPMANYLLRQAGVDQDTAALLIQGRAKVMEALRKSGRLGIVSKADTDAARKLQETLETLRQVSEGLGRSIMTTLTPVIVDLLKPLQEWIEANREWIRTEITARVREFGDYLKSIDWRSIGQGILNFVTGCNEAAKAVGGWGNVVKILFGLWLGKQFAAVLANIGLLRLALTGGKLSGGLMSALGVLGTAGLAGVLATSVATDAAVPNAAKPGVITRSDDENTGAADAGGMWGAVKRGARGLYRRGRRMFGGGEADADADDRYSDGIRRRGRRNAQRVEEGGAAPPRGNGRGNAGAARTGEMMRYAMDQLRREGVPEGQLRQSAAHLVGQATMESSLNPNLTHDPDASGRPTGYGIYGARLGRRDRMLRWLEKNGYARNSAEGQMRYMAHEAMNDATYSKTRRILMGQGTGNIDADTDTITKNFESPKVINRRSGAVRNALRVGGEPAPDTGAGRRPDVLADPKDDRRKPAAAPTPAVAPSAWNGIPAAAAAVAQVQAAQSARIASISNDNRRSETRTDTTNMHGPINVYSSAENANDLIGDLKASLKGRAYAMASNSGQA